MRGVLDLWVYLSGSPLLWLTATLGAYILGETVFSAVGRHPLANPAVVAIIVLSALLLVSHTSYSAYFAGAQFVHFLLGPATVALALPLFRFLPQVRRALLPMLVALICGSITAILSAIWLARLFGLSEITVRALAGKSTTAAVAMGIAEKIGSDPALTGALVLTTGVVGAVIVTPLMNRLGVKNYAARGFAAGLAAHGLGTARAFQVDPLAGTFAGIALGLNGLVTSILVPVLLTLQ